MSNGMQPAALLGNSLASATLNSHGDFTWRTQRAREWMEIYLEECGVGAQLRVQHWIARVASGTQGCNQVGSRICLSRPGATLHIHLIGRTEEGEFLILLEEFREPEYSRTAAAEAMARPAALVAAERGWFGRSAVMSFVASLWPSLRKA